MKKFEGLTFQELSTLLDVPIINEKITFLFNGTLIELYSDGHFYLDVAPNCS